MKCVLPGRIPKGTCISEERSAHGFQSATDEITVLLGETQMTITIFHNGNYIFKHLAVYPSENPGAIRGVPTSHLPML